MCGGIICNGIIYLVASLLATPKVIELAHIHLTRLICMHNASSALINYTELYFKYLNK